MKQTFHRYRISSVLHLFDDIDRRIIRELQRDAAQSQVALAERVGASTASVWRRLKRLEEMEVLGPTVRPASAEKLGRAVTSCARFG